MYIDRNPARSSEFGVWSSERLPPHSARIHRGGFSLILVMVAVSTALVLTVAFTRIQTTVIRIRENDTRRDLALQAAQTGAAVALQQLNSPDWQGVAVPLTNVVHSDEAGVASYVVAFDPLRVEESPELVERGSMPADAALYLKVQSTGIWEARRDSRERVERRVQVTARLRPRLPGRTIGPGDSATVDDLAANPGDYDVIQQYALFAERGFDSLILDPADRIDGDVWLYGDLRLYHDPYWSSSTRDDMLESIGSRFVTNDGQIRHPHPIAGAVIFAQDPDTIRYDLDMLRVPWKVATSRLEFPAIDVSAWRSYRLYEGGFEYDATEIETWQLQNVVLRPTRDNPLGIFYRGGNLRLEDDVTIQGTLVAAGRIDFAGRSIHVGSFNGRGENGTGIVSNVEDWPRLPALVADNVEFDRNSAVSIEGAVALADSLRGAGGDFEYVDASAVDISGTATARPLRQPYSLVQFDQAPDFTQFDGSGHYAIWLQEGPTGNWFPIVKVDAGHNRVTIIGEANHPSATRYQIRRSRRRFVDIRGPVSGAEHDLNRPPAWTALSSDDWSELRNRWKDENKDREDDGLSPIPFVDWLADPANFEGWPYPHSIYGLKLEPTFHLRSTPEITYRWSPPLFGAYDGSQGDEHLVGYRWEIVSWRIVP